MINRLTSVKKYLFPLLVVLIFAVLSATSPSKGLATLQNTFYFLKEMLFIMPVIFILTALIDSWIPKKKIKSTLGKDAGFKGNLFAFLLGSVSAGPIYAAFPICSILYKKGASLKNISILLSSWAVIKIPMLLNEGKFLGIHFMLIRWVLTLISIYTIATILNRVVHEIDLEDSEHQPTPGVHLNASACIGCGLCIKQLPNVFALKNGKAVVSNPETGFDVAWIIDHCPVNAIDIKAIDESI